MVAGIAHRVVFDLCAWQRTADGCTQRDGKRTHALCTHIVEHYNGDAAKIWKGVRDPQELFARIRALPGYGEEKAKIFLAILGKRLKVAPKGWEECATPFSDAQPRSVADIDSPEALQQVRAWKQAQKAKGRSKAE